MVLENVINGKVNLSHLMACIEIELPCVVLDNLLQVSKDTNVPPSALIEEGIIEVVKKYTQIPESVSESIPESVSEFESESVSESTANQLTFNFENGTSDYAIESTVK